MEKTKRIQPEHDGYVLRLHNTTGEDNGNRIPSYFKGWNPNDESPEFTTEFGDAYEFHPRGMVAGLVYSHLLNEYGISTTLVKFQRIITL